VIGRLAVLETRHGIVAQDVLGFPRHDAPDRRQLMIGLRNKVEQGFLGGSPAAIRSVYWLVGVLVANLLALAIIISVFTLSGHTARESAGKTVLGVALQLRHETYDDSWWPMLKAYGAKNEDPAAGLYDVFFDDDVKFQYPPSALLPFDLLPRSMTVVGGRTEFDPRLKRALQLLSLTAVIGTILVSALIVIRGIADSIARSDARFRWVIAVLALSVVDGLLWYPILIGHVWGQVQVFLNLLVALSIYCFVLHRPALGGFWLGLCCLVKPHYGIVLIWSLLRREWRFGIGMTCIGVAGLIGGLCRYGWSDHFAYARVLLFLSRRGESIWVNQSLGGLINRFYGNGAAVETPGAAQSSFPPYLAEAHIVGALFAGIVLLAALWPSHEPRTADKRLELATIIAAVTIASPIAWMHQYGALLPVFAILLARMASKPGIWPLFLLGASFVAMGQVILEWRWYFANPWRGLLGSHVFFGGLLLLGLLFRSRFKGMVRVAPVGAFGVTQSID
jgi:hypothetical protein